MVETAFQTALFCIIAAVLCKVLEKYTKEQALVLSVGAVCAVLAGAVMWLSPFFEAINGLFESVGMEGSYTRIIFKTLGICYITQLSADICRDCKETALASAVELFGRITVMGIALPLFTALIDIINSLI